MKLSEKISKGINWLWAAENLKEAANHPLIKKYEAAKAIEDAKEKPSGNFDPSKLRYGPKVSKK